MNDSTPQKQDESMSTEPALNAGLEAFPDKKTSPRKIAIRKKLLRAVYVAEAELLHSAMTHRWMRNHKSLSEAALAYSSALSAHHASL